MRNYARSVNLFLSFLFVLVFSAIVVWAASNEVTLITPVDGATNWTNSVNFMCNVSAVDGAMNLTLYHNQSGVWTNVTTNDSIIDGHNTSLIVTIGDGQDIGWSCLTANTTDEVWSIVNYSVNIDNSNPEAFNFTLPASMSATTGSTNNTPILIWNATVDSNFLNYTVLVTDSNDFDNPNYTYELIDAVSNNTFEVGVDTLTNGSTSDGWADGAWYWKVIACDGSQVNGSDMQCINSSVDDGTTLGYYIYNVDVESPNVTLSCSSSSVLQDDEIICSCAAVDIFDSNPTRDYTLKPNTASTGIFSTSCTATDSTGNAASRSFSYTVSIRPHGGSMLSSDSSLNESDEIVVSNISSVESSEEVQSSESNIEENVVEEKQNEYIPIVIIIIVLLSLVVVFIYYNFKSIDKYLSECNRKLKKYVHKMNKK